MLLSSQAVRESPWETERNADRGTHTATQLPVCEDGHTGTGSLHFKQTKGLLMGAGIPNQWTEERETLQEALAQNLTRGRSPSACPTSPPPEDAPHQWQPFQVGQHPAFTFMSPTKGIDPLCGGSFHCKTTTECPLEGLQKAGACCIFLSEHSSSLNPFPDALLPNPCHSCHSPQDDFYSATNTLLRWYPRWKTRF